MAIEADNMTECISYEVQHTVDDTYGVDTVVCLAREAVRRRFEAGREDAGLGRGEQLLQLLERWIATFTDIKRHAAGSNPKSCATWNGSVRLQIFERVRLGLIPFDAELFVTKLL